MPRYIRYRAEQLRDNPVLLKRRRMLKDAKWRAKLRGLPFDITIDDVPSPTHCPALGIELDWASAIHQGDASPTLDRAVNTLGYVKGNVRVISAMANRIKTDATTEQIAQVLVYAIQSKGTT